MENTWPAPAKHLKTGDDTSSHPGGIHVPRQVRFQETTPKPEQRMILVFFLKKVMHHLNPTTCQIIDQTISIGVKITICQGCGTYLSHYWLLESSVSSEEENRPTSTCRTYVVQYTSIHLVQGPQGVLWSNILVVLSLNSEPGLYQLPSAALQGFRLV